jgi:hypothetical protein
MAQRCAPMTIVAVEHAKVHCLKTGAQSLSQCMCQADSLLVHKKSVAEKRYPLAYLKARTKPRLASASLFNGSDLKQSELEHSRTGLLSAWGGGYTVPVNCYIVATASLCRRIDHVGSHHSDFSNGPSHAWMSSAAFNLGICDAYSSEFIPPHPRCFADQHSRAVAEASKCTEMATDGLARVARTCSTWRLRRLLVADEPAGESEALAVGHRSR